eukprot:g48338.t1
MDPEEACSFMKTATEMLSCSDSKSIKKWNMKCYGKPCQKAGCPGKFINILHLLHNMTSVMVLTDSHMTEHFEVKTGVKCVITPKLFSIFTTTILRHVKNKLPSGVDIVYRMVKILFNLTLLKSKKKISLTSLVKLHTNGIDRLKVSNGFFKSHKPQSDGDSPLPQSHKPQSDGDSPWSQSHKPQSDGDSPWPQSHKPQSDCDSPWPQSHKPQSDGDSLWPQSHKLQSDGDNPWPQSHKPQSDGDNPWPQSHKPQSSGDSLWPQSHKPQSDGDCPWLQPHKPQSDGDSPCPQSHKPQSDGDN